MGAVEAACGRVLLPAVLLAITLSACGGDGGGEAANPDLGDPSEEVWEGSARELVERAGMALGTQADWVILQKKVRWAWEQGLDSVPIGDAVARLGASFVGTAYEAHTLDPPGPEKLVINFRGFDCVTFVENMLALAHFLRVAPRDALDDPVRYIPLYGELLRDIRYRDGEMSGYPGRLHYFTDWIWDNQRKEKVQDLSQRLGGVLDPEPIDFMSTHPDAYHQLSDPAVLEAIREAEGALNRGARYYVPQDDLARRVASIRHGDIIAATSTVAGLDIAHTGIAFRVGSELHLLHAPLAGGVVEISPLPLAQRILGLSSQDGIMVARPLECRNEC